MGIRRGEITTKIISDGLVFNMDAANRACYPRTGTTATDTIGNIAGTLSGASGDNNTPQWENTNNGVFDFDGTDDYIDFSNPSALQFTSDFSISGWFKTSAGGNHRIFSKDDNSNRSYLVQVQSNGSVIGGIFVSNSTSKLATSSTGFDDGNWHHFGFTYEEGVGLKLYMDGGTPATLSYTAAPNLSTAADIEIGRKGNGANYFNGNIASVKAYNRVLSPSEVLQNYNGLRGRFGV